MGQIITNDYFLLNIIMRTEKDEEGEARGGTLGLSNATRQPD